MMPFDQTLRALRALTPAALVGAFLAGCGSGTPPPGTGGPGGPPMAPPVTAAAAISRTVTDFDEFSGRLDAVEKVELRPRVSGYIEKIHFAQGGEVRKGDLLVEIDARPFELEAHRVEQQIASAKTRFELAAGELARVEKLVESGAVSRCSFPAA